jgi:hypothetical protein
LAFIKNFSQELIHNSASICTLGSYEDICAGKYRSVSGSSPAYQTAADDKSALAALPGCGWPAAAAAVSLGDLAALSPGDSWVRLAITGSTE